ncbi:MAG: diacylglycerol/polyprenol kinase family protein, partial [Anaerolineae bacterium]
DQWQWGVIPFATFIGLNYIFYRRGTFEQMDSEEESPGTIYFAISITVLFALLWPRGSEPLAAAAAMILTWGDGLAALIGRRFGQRTYTFFDHTRTLEGSAAFVVASQVTATLTWQLYAPDVTGLPMALLLGGVGTVVGALAEAVSTAGLDNLTVPLLAAVAMALAGGL